VSPVRRLLFACVLCSAAFAASAADDEYAQMLGYLADSRMDGRALAGASGAIAANLAAGDLNLQANLRSVAVGDRAAAGIAAAQQRLGDRYDVPRDAQARIGGQALAGASGLASINQASGSANAELNAVAMTLAQQGIRETPDSALSTGAFASAGRQNAAIPAGRTASRNVAVEATALHGFEGVLQLNQIAGSANATDNQLLLSVSPGP